VDLFRDYNKTGGTHPAVYSPSSPRFLEVTDHSTPPSESEPAVSLHLLDSTSGNIVRTWSFHDRAVVNIGRLEDNDVVVMDPAVSRLHATLRFQNSRWLLESVGKHGVLIDDGRVESTWLEPKTVFRLGAHGPTLMFECVETKKPESQICTSTVEFDTFSVATLSIDRESTAAQVQKITDDESFQTLLKQAAELRKRRTAARD
jgi:pSer/pThr/pTyr-binding forkhead associated (FHA) protein